MTDLILGIEIGGTKLQLSLGTPEGEIVASTKGFVDVSTGSVGIRQWLLEQIPNFIGSSGYSNSRIAAIGCGFGGPIDQRRGRVLKSVQMKGWKDFPLKEWFEEAFKLPTWIENDSNAATWGEYCLGFGVGCQHFFYTNIGSGVGGGFVLNGSLFDREGFGAGEFGHTYVPNLINQKLSEPVKIENICSGWAIEQRLRQPGYVPASSLLYMLADGNVGQISTSNLGEAAQQGDTFALAEIDLVAHALGIGLANVLCLTNVVRIAIGVCVSKLGELLIDRVRKYTDQYIFVISEGRYQIQRSFLGESIVVVGAILLASKLL